MAHDILIVDDEADIRMLIASILRDEGYATREAADSEEALAAVHTRQPTLVILDIWLQNSQLDGIEILHHAVGARCHDQRAWHDRNSGRGNQDRCL
jgi:two-component system, NtrC family, nitrogen regulation response regulator NtrX